ncbi:hypothetical protein L3X38_026220 [Prunus dulcis]|uniref:Uncharacterized protein n=1 Tax=Prunus dulcis TaxID=3755 RepID=A0AAD4W3X9_PRUDU|nr:hypothetical protein L3X38_026220 [Prunus dulcis]
MAQANIESNLGIRCDESLARKRAEALGEMDREVKVGALHKVPMWDFVQAVVVATRVLEISLAFGSFGRCLAPRKCVFLRHGRRRGCLGASHFDAGSARPRKCVFLRHGRRRGCLGASHFDAGSARFIMV